MRSMIWYHLKDDAKAVARRGMTCVTMVTILAVSSGESHSQSVNMRSRAPSPVAIPALDSLTPDLHYASPDACLAAVHRIDAAVFWGQEPDTLPADSERVSNEEARTARSCGHVFSADSVLERSLGALQRLALTANDDAWDAEVLRRRVTLAARKPALARAAILADAAGAEVWSIPARLDVGERLARLLDSLGTEVALSRGQAYGGLMTRALIIDSLDRARRYAPRFMAAIIDMPREQRRDGWISGAATALALTMLPQGGPLSSDMARRYRDSVTALFGADQADPIVGRVGLPAPSVTGEFWPDTASKPVIRPTAGRRALIVFLDSRCGPNCAPDYALLKRLTARFASEVPITVVAQTRGYFRRVLLAEPVQEIARVRAYYSEYRRVPGTLVGTTTPFFKRPAPDRRRVDSLTATQQRYGSAWGGHYDVTAFVVNEDGLVVWPPMSLGGESEPLLVRLLNRRSKMP